MADDTWRAKIGPYLDAELPADDMKAMEAHLRSCAACAADLVRHVELKRVTRIAGRRYAPSAEFRRRMQLQVASRRRPPRRWIWVPALAVTAAVLLLAVTWLVAGWQRSRSEQLLGQLADLHVTNLASSNPVDVVSTDRHTVKPWFQGKLPFTFDLPELQGSPFVLVGGRLAYLEHAPGAHLIYKVRNHYVSVFVFQDRPEFSRAMSGGVKSASVLSFQVTSWRSDGLRYFVFGDASPADIQQLSELIRHQRS